MSYNAVFRDECRFTIFCKVRYCLCVHLVYSAYCDAEVILRIILPSRIHYLAECAPTLVIHILHEKKENRGKKHSWLHINGRILFRKLRRLKTEQACWGMKCNVPLGLHVTEGSAISNGHHFITFQFNRILVTNCLTLDSQQKPQYCPPSILCR